MSVDRNCQSEAGRGVRPSHAVTREQLTHLRHQLSPATSTLHTRDLNRTSSRTNVSKGSMREQGYSVRVQARTTCRLQTRLDQTYHPNMRGRRAVQNKGSLQRERPDSQGGCRTLGNPSPSGLTRTLQGYNRPGDTEPRSHITCRSDDICRHHTTPGR